MANYNNKELNQAMQKHKNQLLDGLFGLEKESIRVTELGELSQKSHPKAFGDKNMHPYITTDFSESQLELITPPLHTVKESHGFLETIQDIVSENIDNELLWPQSAPPKLPPLDEIPVAKYGEKGKEKEQYRNMLAEVYGKERQMISGVHFNFSLPDKLIEQLWKILDSKEELVEFKNELYLKIVRNFLKHRWVLIWLFGQSPAAHKTFKVKSLYTGKRETLQCSTGLSLRTSSCGYRNKEEFFINFNSLEAYKTSINDLIRAGKIFVEKELYSPIRLKFIPENSLDLSHLEVRLLDINPFEKTGISIDTLHFIHLYLIYSLLKEEKYEMNARNQLHATENQDIISCHGIEEHAAVIDENGNFVKARDVVINVLDDIYKSLEQFGVFDHKEYKNGFDKVYDMGKHPEKRQVYELMKEIDQKGFTEFHLEKARQYKKDSFEKAYKFHAFEDMELSTQLLLKSAILRGVHFEIMDRQENFVHLYLNGTNEYVQQATKTSLDSYSSILMMENKIVTKKILEIAGINVPEGGEYTNAKKANEDFEIYSGRSIVIKPKSTNFGIGISILKESWDFDTYKRAIAIAFEKDSAILIEEFIEGKEFRVFIINEEVVGILHRVPANVTGDGKSSIRELVAVKNQNPLRGKGYRTPLEKINLGEAEEMFLKSQGFDFESVPKLNSVVFLRENSNISTGGDSVDFTDEVHESYKKIAIDAAKALNVKITGLDMIIPDHSIPANDLNYSIIELNFNPAIHIHCYPFIGKNRKLNEKILTAIGF